ncbi:hypothetical protein [Granulicella sp. L46]|uniref:hypothetical protein n=1 Tax=Granulicella sp. L46 TaxID=1641865 RepID=UPI00131BE8F9|nr:hypothetical protein [Granulicella sp. L46]
MDEDSLFGSSSVLLNQPQKGLTKLTVKPPVPSASAPDDSQIIVQGVVYKEVAHLTSGNRAVYTQLHIDVTSVYKTDDPTIRPGAALSFLNAGGVVIDDGGNTTVVRNSRTGFPTLGRSYLFFGTKASRPGVYILTNVLHMTKNGLGTATGVSPIEDQSLISRFATEYPQAMKDLSLHEDDTMPIADLSTKSSAALSPHLQSLSSRFAGTYSSGLNSAVPHQSSIVELGLLPANKAELGVVAHIVSSQTVVTADHSAIFTDYTAVVDQNIYHHDSYSGPLPQIGSTVSFHMFGGRFRAKSGDIITVDTAGHPFPPVGTKQILLLDSEDEDKAFSLVHSYLVMGSNVVSPEHHRGRYQEIETVPLEDFLSQLQIKAVTAPSNGGQR